MTDDQTRRIRQLEDENMSLLENVKDYDKIISILLNEIGGRFEISDGDSFLFIERMLPDFKFLAGTVNITVTTQDYSGSGSAVRINTYGPYPVTEGQQYVRIRARGRMAKIRIESNDLDSFWRLGKIVFYTSQMGSR